MLTGYDTSLQKLFYECQNKMKKMSAKRCMRELLKRLDYRAQPSQLFYGLLMRAWMELGPDAWLLVLG